jgi:DeoR/GlpR family transcriptional regulator of sugar metabolism
VVGVGAATIEAIGQIRADLYFMGVCSLHPEGGLSTGDYEEACVKRALARASAETIVLASPEKLATASPYQVLPLSEVDAIVTLDGVSESLLAPYRAAGLALHLAKVGAL